jgi:hypothetical protein
MDDGRAQEEYIRQVLEGYRKTRVRWGLSAVRTECWPHNSINAASPQP